MRQGTLKLTLVSLLPAALLYLVFFIYPSIQALYVSLFEWSGFSPDMKFVGLGNFIELFSDRHFWTVVMSNTLLILFVGGALIFVIAFLFSSVLSGRVQGKKLLRAAIFFPNVVNPIALAILWSFIYNKQWGLLNSFLKTVGLGGLVRTWAAPDTLFWALLVALVWIYVGFFVVILLAALDRIPPDLIEAANLEGASEFTVFFRIKLPLIWDVLMTAIILWGIMAVKEFAFLYAWGGGAQFPPDGAQNLAVFMFVTAFGRRVSVYRMGYATAMGVVMLILIVIIALVVQRIFRREAIQY